MLVEFVRAVSPSEYSDNGEDDGISGETRELVIGIAPDTVAAAFESTESGVVIIRLRDGRGFKVRGTYAEVSAKLRGETPPPTLTVVPN
jgi:hypothetical protein